MRAFKRNFLTFVLAGFFLLLFSGNLFARRIIKLKVFPLNAQISVDDKRIIKNLSRIKRIYLKKGEHTLLLSAKGYLNKTLNLNVQRNQFIEIKLEKKESLLKFVKLLPTGGSPKSVEFSEDGKYFFSGLLRGAGIAVFSVKDLKQIAVLKPSKRDSKKTGFVEVAFLPFKKELWVSQMQGKIHVFDSESFKYKKSFKTRGVWSKVLLVHPDQKGVFVTNWKTRSISVIDPNTYKAIRVIKIAGIPRGLVLSPDHRYLYVALFNRGKILKIDLNNYKLVKSFGQGRCMRHIVADYSSKRFFVSDMILNRIYIYSFENERLLKIVGVGKKPNTIKLSPDKKYLYVSCRGKNGRNYLLKGPEFGKIYVIDTNTYQVLEWHWGMNQPTGLGVSPNGEYIVFSDMLDNQLEIYRKVDEKGVDAKKE